MSMTAEQLFSEIQGLPQPEKDKLVRLVRELDESPIPADFLEALDDFEQGRFVTMEQALHGAPPEP